MQGVARQLPTVSVNGSRDGRPKGAVMKRRAGRPPASLELITHTHSEMAAKLGTSESTVKRQLSIALAKLEADGQLENLLALAHHAQATRERKIAGVRIQCGSIECRREIWVLYADR